MQLKKLKVFAKARLRSLTVVVWLIIGVALSAYFIPLTRLDLCRSTFVGTNLWGGPKFLVKSQVDPGYFLLENEGKILLLNKAGQILHHWKIQRPVLSAELIKGGDLVVSANLNRIDQFSVDPRNFNGTLGDTIMVLDWEGNVKTRAKLPMMHHQMELTPDGHILALSFESFSAYLYVNQDFSLDVPKSGFSNINARRDTIVLADLKGNIKWEWKISDHLQIPKDAVAASPGEAIDYFHVNRAHFINKNPITGKPAILASLRNTNTLAFIEYPSGKVVWKLANITSRQHDPSLLENGNILVFDNGVDLKPFPYSRVLEINPRTNSIVREIRSASIDIGQRTQFFSAVAGFARRTKNDNTMIVDSIRGHIFEVSPSGSLVWSFLNPVTYALPNPTDYLFARSSSIFLFHYVAPDVVETLPIPAGEQKIRRLEKWLCEDII